MAPPEHPGTLRPRTRTGRIVTSTVLATVGMTVALAATWPSAGSQPDAPGRRLALDLPDWMAGVVALALVALFFAIVANSLPALRRAEPPPASLLSSVVGALLLVAPLLAGTAAGTWVLWRSDWRGLHLASVGPGEAGDPPGHAAHGALHVPAADLGLTLGLASVSLIAIGFALWLLSQNDWLLPGLVGPRRRRRCTGLMTELSSAVAAGIDELSTDGDPRGAVIACYRRCERAIGRQHHRRRQWQTPREYVHGALSALPLPAQPAASLIAVFERARFDDQPITPADRDAALAALGAIRAALEEGGRDGSRH